VFITEATFGLPVFRHGDPALETQKLLSSVALFPERAHLVGAYALGKAQRLIALIRQAGYDKPIHLHGALESLTRYYGSRGIDLGEVRLARDADKGALAGAIVLCPPSAVKEVWSRRFPDPVTSFASGWMRVRGRARQRQIELPLVISDHADWDALCAAIAATGAGEVWVTHGEEDALVHWCQTQGLRARPLRIVGYREEEQEAVPAESEP
jgi:putative mRNA 3-end processing factor